MSTATITFELRHVDLATGPLDYYVAGSGNPIVYLHSAGGPRFTSSLETLAEQHTSTSRSHRDSAEPTESTASRACRTSARHYAAFIETLGAPTIDLIGHSFGGWVALRVALEAKGRIGQMVLEAPAGLHAKGSVQEGGTPEEIQARFFVHPRAGAGAGPPSRRRAIAPRSRRTRRPRPIRTASTASSPTDSARSRRGRSSSSARRTA